MKNAQRLIEELVEKLEEYGKTYIEVARLKAIRTTSIVASQLAAKSIILLVMSMFIFSLSIGISLWVGSLMGAYYLGFFVVAGCYLIISLILIFAAPNLLQKGIRSFIIRHVLKD